jgi:cell volume regulation protein A
MADGEAGGVGEHSGSAMSLEILLGTVAAVVLLGVLAVRVSVRLGLPSLLIYLGMGVLLGESVLGIQFSDAALTESVGLAALVLILVEGGLTTRWAAVRPALGIGIALATLAVAASIAVVGVALHLLLDLDWRSAFLWGAVLSSTDAAAVFSVLRGVGVSRRLAGALELESGLNDAPAVIAVLLLASGDPLTWQTPVLVVYELAAGAALGWLFGRGGAAALRRAALPATGLYPLATMAVCVLAYSVGQLAHASGLLATYVAALVLGNSDLPHRGGVRSFAEGTGWLAQIGLFVLLGLYASPPRLPAAVVPALVAGLVLIVAARPLSVLVAATPFRVPWREQAFLSWAGLRGAVPIVLALIALTEGAPGAQSLFDSVFVLVVVLTVVQGTTLPSVARWLRVARPAEPTEIEVDAAPLEELGADLLQVRVPVGSQLRGVYIGELRLPRGATVSLVVRDEAAFTPNRETRLRELDQLLVVTTAEVREATEERLRAVDERGRLARWRPQPPERPRRWWGSREQGTDGASAK